MMTSEPSQAAAPFAHAMLREIFEQPACFEATLDHYLTADGFCEATCAPAVSWLASIKDEALLAASGSSRHAALIAESLLEEASGLALDVEYASEYLYRAQRSRKHVPVMVLSQSGETADTLQALRQARQAGLPTLAMTNAPGSSMDREAQYCFPTLAGRERAIPATKSFTAQLLNLYLLSLLAARQRAIATDLQLHAALQAARQLPALVAAQLEPWHQQITHIASTFDDCQSFLFLGRGIHFPVAREGALKLKESAYLHAEGYPSGELKHGPNALVSRATPLVILATYDPADQSSVLRYEKTLQLMQDLQTQGANMLAIANTNDHRVAQLAASMIEVEPMREALLPCCEVIPLQLFAYAMAVRRGIDVDHPRNLTKAVLVE